MSINTDSDIKLQKIKIIIIIIINQPRMNMRKIIGPNRFFFYIIGPYRNYK
jgi:hypothetical protein